MANVNVFCKKALILAWIYWLATILFVLILFCLAVWQFGWVWTGFLRDGVESTVTQTDPNGNITTDKTITGIPGKTLWDLLDLVIIPAALAGGVYLLNKAEGEREAKRRGIEKERQEKLEQEENAKEEKRREQREQEAVDQLRENEWQTYLDRMADLLEKGLRNSDKASELRNIARVRTLTTLRRLDGVRKGMLLRFLGEAKLIDDDEVVIHLYGADLNGADLSNAVLDKTNLYKVDLSRAKLNGSFFGEANLKSCTLIEADLGGASLENANLSEAHLAGARLVNANMPGAILIQADLREVNLSEAYLREANLHRANFSNWNPHQNYLLEANLSNINLNKANLSQADLYGANLFRANLSETNLSQTILQYLRQQIFGKSHKKPKYLVKISYFTQKYTLKIYLRRLNLKTGSAWIA